MSNQAFGVAYRDAPEMARPLPASKLGGRSSSNCGSATPTSVRRVMAKLVSGSAARLQHRAVQPVTRLRHVAVQPPPENEQLGRWASEVTLGDLGVMAS